MLAAGPSMPTPAENTYIINEVLFHRDKDI
jgi:hypothetical protein